MVTLHRKYFRCPLDRPNYTEIYSHPQVKFVPSGLKITLTNLWLMAVWLGLRIFFWKANRLLVHVFVIAGGEEVLSDGACEQGDKLQQDVQCFSECWGPQSFKCEGKKK